MEAEQETVQPAFENPFANEPKLFGKWSYNDLKVDVTCDNYIDVRTTKSRVFLPHTAGRYQRMPFKKATCPLIERIIGALSFHGRNTGKKVKAMRIMRQTLELIELQTGENPIQIVINAIQNGGAREDSQRLGTSGVAKRIAVDVSTFRRINQSIYFITKHAREKCFKNIKNVAETLADEFIKCAKNESTCPTLMKKQNIELNAKSNR